MVGIVDSIFRNFYIPPIIFGEPSFILHRGCRILTVFWTSCNYPRRRLGDKDLHRWKAALDVDSEVRVWALVFLRWQPADAVRNDNRFMDGLVRSLHHLSFY